tara:strand:- start:578 stop:766 length:189 start_codon:yes stop_codon:yes gene_type:complete
LITISLFKKPFNLFFKDSVSIFSEKSKCANNCLACTPASVLPAPTTSIVLFKILESALFNSF